MTQSQPHATNNTPFIFPMTGTRGGRHMLKIGQYQIMQGPFRQFTIWRCRTGNVMEYLSQALGKDLLNTEVMSGGSSNDFTLILFTNPTITLEKLTDLLAKGFVGRSAPIITGPTVIGGYATTE